MKLKRLPPDHRIIKRRQDEEKIADMQAVQKNLKDMGFRVQWESKSEYASRRKWISGRTAELEEAYEASLNERRIKLANILETEQLELQEEIEAAKETPAQVREGLIRRAAEIERQKEQERLKIVSLKLKQAERLACDEMRQTKSKVLEKLAFQEQQRQVKQKQLELNEEKSRNKLDDKQIEYARVEAVKQSAKLAQEREKSKHILSKDLDEQVAELRARKAKQAEDHKRETYEWLESLKAAEIELQQKQKELIKLQNYKRAELIKENIEIAKGREKDQEEAKLDGIHLIGEALLDLHREKMAERQKKLNLREDIHKQEIGVKQRREEQEKVRNLIAEKNQQERERVWKEVDELEQHKASKLEALMTEVCDTRRQQVNEKIQRLAIEKQENEAYQEKLLKQAAKDIEVQQSAAIRKRNKDLAYRQLLVAQIEEKHQNHLKALQDSKDEAQKMKLQREAIERNIKILQQELLAAAPDESER